MLDYKLDHCHRLLKGSETAMEDYLSTSARWPREKRTAFQTTLKELKVMVNKLINQLNCAEVISDRDIESIHKEMNSIANMIKSFHDVVQRSPSTWGRHLIIPQRLGSKLPMGLIIPIVVDGFVDGFLIGVAYALSAEAGMILAAANTLEMSFLGITLSSSVSKCTGSSRLARRAAIFTPPLVMLVASAVGVTAGQAAQSNGLLYSAFVAFGVVALLALVCKELLIEAHSAQGEDVKWYISIMTFAGIFVVLMLNRFIA